MSVERELENGMLDVIIQTKSVRQVVPRSPGPQTVSNSAIAVGQFGAPFLFVWRDSVAWA